MNRTACACVALATMSLLVRNATAQMTELISVSISGGPGNGWSVVPDLTPDGRFVAFASAASDLVPGDSNGSDTFMLDRVTGILEAISVDAGGNLVTGHGAAVSADGRYVAFASESSILVDGDTNGTMDVFVRDRANGALARVSISSTGSEGTGESYNFGDIDISDDGRFVAFSSSLVGLVDSELPNGYHVYLHDRDADDDRVFDEIDYGAIITICVSQDAAQRAVSLLAAMPSLSNDGNRVGFFVESFLPDDSVPYGAYVYDRATLITRHISSATWPRCTRTDGRYWVFSSWSSNVVEGDTNGFSDVFIYDYDLETLDRLVVGLDGEQTDGDSFYPSISDNGRYVAFVSLAANLVANDGNDVADVFILDRDVDDDRVLDEPDCVEMYLASVNSQGQQQTEMGPGPCWCSWVMSPISSDGRTCAFVSQPGNLAEPAGGVATPIDSLNTFVHVRNEPAACPGDFDGNAAIDDADLQLLLADWGACFGCETELDGDNVVGPADLAALLAAWGKCP